jgi:hypothetical protein
MEDLTSQRPQMNRQSRKTCSWTARSIEQTSIVAAMLRKPAKARKLPSTRRSSQRPKLKNLPNRRPPRPLKQVPGHHSRVRTPIAFRISKNGDGLWRFAPNLSTKEIARNRARLRIVSPPHHGLNVESIKPRPNVQSCIGCSNFDTSKFTRPGERSASRKSEIPAVALFTSSLFVNSRRHMDFRVL